MYKYLVISKLILKYIHEMSAVFPIFEYFSILIYFFKGKVDVPNKPIYILIVYRQCYKGVISLEA